MTVGPSMRDGRHAASFIRFPCVTSALKSRTRFHLERHFRPEIPRLLLFRHITSAFGHGMTILPSSMPLLLCHSLTNLPSAPRNDTSSGRLDLDRSSVFHASASPLPFCRRSRHHSWPATPTSLLPICNIENSPAGLLAAAICMRAARKHCMRASNIWMKHAIYERNLVKWSLRIELRIRKLTSDRGETLEAARMLTLFTYVLTANFRQTPVAYGPGCAAVVQGCAPSVNSLQNLYM